MRLTRLLLLLMPLLAAVGCGHAPHARLRAIDGIIESRPDSAMALLGAIDRAGFSEADSAYYALLYTQAQIKTNVYLTSDSLISRALDAYRFSSDPDLRKRAHFYAAKVAYNTNDLPRAMKCGIVAYDISKRSSDNYWIAKCAELIADIYKDIYNYPQAEKYNCEAIDYYGKAGKIRNQRYSICDLATNHINLEQLNKSIIIIDSIRNIVHDEEPFDSDLDNYAVGVKIEALARMNDYDGLKRLLSNYSSHSSGEEEISVALLNSYIATNSGDSAANLSYLIGAYNLSTRDKDRIRVLYAAYVNYMELNNYREAALLSDSIISIQSNIAKEILFESISAIPNNYYAEETRYQRQQTRFVELCLWVSSIIALIVITFGILFYRQRMKANREEFEANLVAISQLQIQMEEDQDKIESLLHEKCATLAKLCEEYYELGSTTKARQRIIQRVDEELAKLRTPEAIINLENSNDKYIGGIIHQLRVQCDFLNETEQHLLALILNKYPVRTICVILDIKYKNFYLKKSRIVKKISNSSVAIKNELLSRLSS